MNKTLTVREDVYLNILGKAKKYENTVEKYNHVEKLKKKYENFAVKERKEKNELEEENAKLKFELNVLKENAEQVKKDYEVEYRKNYVEELRKNRPDLFSTFLITEDLIRIIHEVDSRKLSKDSKKIRKEILKVFIIKNIMIGKDIEEIASMFGYKSRGLKNAIKRYFGITYEELNEVAKNIKKGYIYSEDV